MAMAVSAEVAEPVVSDETRRCKHCGTPFSPRADGHLYCQERCRRNHGRQAARRFRARSLSAACRRKIAYLSEQAAAAAASHLNQREGQAPLTVYDCVVCPAWHLTSHEPLTAEERERAIGALQRMAERQGRSWTPGMGEDLEVSAFAADREAG